MLRTAEGITRSAMARLEFLGRELTVKKKEEEKEEEKKKGTDATMAGTAAVPATARSRRRGGRARRAAPPPVAAEERPLAADSPPPAEVPGAVPRSRTLKPQLSRERSPRRELSPTAASKDVASLPGSDLGLGGFEVGQTVAFCGLTSRPELVNALGTIMSTDVKSGRVAVRVDSTGESIRVKPVNIKLTIFGAGGRQPQAVL